jgi:hypothetical protein
MEEDILEKMISDIANSYYELLKIGIEEGKEQFRVTILVADFMASLREQNILDCIDDVFNSSFLDKINFEANKYIGGI